MTRRSLFILFGPALLAGSLAFLLPASPSSEAEGSEGGPDLTVQLTVTPVLPERVVLERELSGRVAAYRRVEIRPQIGGLILDRKVDEGMRVAAGDVLFRIDPAPFDADLGAAEAALTRAEAVAAQARRMLDRSDTLLAKNVVSPEKHDAARNDLVLAAADLAEARAVVQRRRLDLDFATLRSPIDGYVASGLADIGGLATPGGDKPLAVVQDLEKVFVDLQVPAAGLDAILLASEAGLGPVRVMADRDGAEPRAGQLRSSDVIVDPGTGNASVRVEVANPDLALLPGMYVRARLPRGVAEDALLVPEDAVLRRGDGMAQVVVVSDQTKATRRDVRLGDRIGTRILVTSGLKPGERVAIRGQDRVPDGTTLQVTPVAADDLPAAPHP
ncbi:efflux RND transporter periplasmic adaptor subunit [Salipiger marinus]|uniref:efflux RND transporter periplasmic adaptor subunit n=1 Tax=Salipiger marinus TaxID=555512 RepID=UPI001E4A6533|nr:efflux RND transporter periplasmic adaptor subunit [Salipiger manganoxidans]MCD1618080.1 efflux RND transporter periplasmic adaptor subunit [Salipiger manganoxidans]MEB3418762.1 efflux RND transporter periplasmic adaptor subunit [Salipiger manganoxidans]